MKKFILLTFMLLSGFSLSAQTNTTEYKYDSYAYSFLGDPVNGISENLYITAYSDRWFTIQSALVESITKAPIIMCIYQGELEGRHYYTGIDIYLNKFNIFTDSKLNTFIHNNGIEDRDHLDESKAIYITPADDIFIGIIIYPIKNK